MPHRSRGVLPSPIWESAKQRRFNGVLMPFVEVDGKGRAGAAMQGR
jgi:hypothetical protein